MNIEEAKMKLYSLKNKSKHEKMLEAAAIITQLSEINGVQPIVVGGLSVEIYTQQEYTTMDIDFVSDGYHIIENILCELDFNKKGRIFYNDAIEVAVEIPDNHLAGSYDKLVRYYIEDESYIYLISVEDIILDRLRAGLHWGSEDDLLWAFNIFSSNYQELDISYLKEKTEVNSEEKELDEWIRQLNKDVPGNPDKE